MKLIKQNIAVTAALIGVLELLGALGCLITTLLLGNVTNTDLQAGQLYAKYYDSSSPTRRFGENGGTYWWIGLPFLLPGMVGIAASATRNFKVMIAFMVTNIISFFAGIALAIFVGLFYNLWKVPMRSYAANNCVFEYHEPTSKTFCQCQILDKADVQLMDADRMWIYVQACDEVEIISMMLIIIISLSIITAVLALCCSYISCYALRFTETPKNQPRTGFNPLPADFRIQQEIKPEEKPMIPRQEPVLQPRNDLELKPQQQYASQPQYASQYPPPYPSSAPSVEKAPPSPDEEEGLDGGWL